MFMDFMMERMWFELLKANRERDCRERQEKENKTTYPETKIFYIEDYKGLSKPKSPQ